MKNKTILICIILLNCLNVLSQDVTITINASQGKKVVSPNIYGCNNSFDKPATFYKEVGLRFSRMNGGNNASKYNWRRKITSHPDWYNNVYSTDWDAPSIKFADSLPGMQVMWAFQLLGKVASNTSNNFDDWSFNQSQYWFGVGQNLAGGGIPNTTTGATKASKEGDINLYTMDWPADSSVEILNHWFGTGGIGLNKNQFLYWNMDNEPDVWDGTHDDVMPTLIPASQFMDNFITLAKKARALFPEIKICGPVTASEYQWYKWGSQSILINGKYYCWLEYFLKRIADEEKASGIRLLDVVDLHNYPYQTTDLNALQLHRMYYDETYAYPGANGLYTINGGYDNTLTKEYIFKRINDWLVTYFGANHGRNVGISEWGPSVPTNNPNVVSIVYGSALGTFANNGVELFSPWIWQTGMWETLNLYSNYAKNNSISSVSSLENTVSAYTTVNDAIDSMTIIVVNRDMNSTKNIAVNLNSFSVTNGTYQTLQLSSLPSTETFISHTDNAAKKGTLSVTDNHIAMSVPALSTTAILLQKNNTTEINQVNVERKDLFKIIKGAETNEYFLSYNLSNQSQVRIDLLDIQGRIRNTLENNTIQPGYYTLPINSANLKSGIYIIQFTAGMNLQSKKLLITE